MKSLYDTVEGPQSLQPVGISSSSMKDLSGHACLSISICEKNQGSNKAHGTAERFWKANLCSRVSGMVDEFSNITCSSFLLAGFSETEFYSAALDGLTLTV